VPHDENSSNPQQGQRGESLALLILALLSVVTLAYLALRESRAAAPYERYQRRYIELTGSEAAPPRVRRIVTVDGEDRCPTCHLGIPGTGHAAHAPALQNPYRPHPTALQQQHPPSRFLCTSCHGDGGAHVDRCLPSRSSHFARSARTPGEAPRLARGDPDGRALGRRMARASCLACHPRGQAEHLPSGELLTLGLAAYRRLGCGGCHRGGELMENASRVGPPLDRVRDKLRPAFVASFLADPQKLRPGTAMPSFFSDEGMVGAPGFTRTRLQRERQQRVEALSAFVLSAPPGTSQRPQPPGDAAVGSRLFRSRGCVACHLPGNSVRLARSARTPGEAPRLARQQAGLGDVGPDLSSAGARLLPSWVQAWLGSPRGYNPETKMPNMRLEPEEVRHLAAYIGTLGSPAAEPVRERDARTVSAGLELARELGCPGCHTLSKLEDAPPVGPDLDGFGSKRAELLDWGSRRPADAARRTWRRWTELKLTRPLAFDRRPGLLLMPWQRLRTGELEGLVVVTRGLVDHPPPGGPATRPRGARRGETLVRELGCRRCHSIAGRGAAIRALWPRPSDRAPSLDGQGSKVLPAWLYGYLRRPVALRPWLELRMPRFTRLGDEGAAMLAGYFAALDRASYPFVHESRTTLQGKELEQAMTLFTRLQCVRCHLVSNAPKLKPGELAPDLALSGERLRRDWIVRFILDPQKLMPGTRMPNLFPLVDEDDPGSRTTAEPDLFGGSIQRQVEALTDLNLAWGSVQATR